MVYSKDRHNMQKKSYHPPELTELGSLRNLVEGGVPKTGPENDSDGVGEVSGSVSNAPVNDQFTRGSRSSSSESSGGRSGRN